MTPKVVLLIIYYHKFLGFTILIFEIFLRLFFLSIKTDKKTFGCPKVFDCFVLVFYAKRFFEFFHRLFPDFLIP